MRRKEVNNRCQEEMELDLRVKAARAAVVAEVKDKAEDKGVLDPVVTAFVRIAEIKNLIKEVHRAIR